MAIIRERQQFRNQRIGVVRTDTGEQQMWQQVGQAADRLMQDVMTTARPLAEQAGAEAAEQVSQEGLLRTIDPATGRAEAFTPPKDMGTIAQQSYRQTMRRRYIRSAENEIKNKAAELFIRYQNDPHGPENYATTMEDYISKMVKSTDTTFAETIKEVGANYLASTKLNLMQKRAAAIADVEKMSLQEDANQFATSVPDFGNDINSLNIALQMEEQANDDAVAAGIQTVSEANANKLRMRRAVQQRNLPQALMYGTQIEYVAEDGSTKTRPLTSKDITMLQSAYQSQGDSRILDKMPKGLRAVYDDSVALGDTTVDDFDELRKATSLLRSNFDAMNANATTNNKMIEDLIRISNGGGDGTSKKDREAVDARIFIDAGIDSIADQTTYYRSAASLTDSNILHVTNELGVPPQGLVRDIKNMVSGMQYKPEEAQRLFQHYLRHSNFVNRNGHTQNMLARVLDPNEIAVLETTAYIANFYGGSENIPNIMSNVIANRQNEDAYKAKLNQMFTARTGPDSSLGLYLADKFGDDSVMVDRYMPFAEYLIANGASKEDLDIHLEKAYNSVYVPTNNLVADVLYSDNIERSMYSLDRVIPNQMGQDLFIMSINADLPEGYHLGSGSKEGSKQVYLVPQDLKGSGISDEYGTLGVIYNAFYKDEFGMLSPVPVKNKEGDPLYMSFDPAAFMRKIGNQLPVEEQPNKATDDQRAIINFQSKTGEKLPVEGTTLEEKIDVGAIGESTP